MLRSLAMRIDIGKHISRKRVRVIIDADQHSPTAVGHNWGNVERFPAPVPETTNTMTEEVQLQLDQAQHCINSLSQ